MSRPANPGLSIVCRQALSCHGLHVHTFRTCVVYLDRFREVQSFKRLNLRAFWNDTLKYKSIIETEIHNYKGTQRVRRKLDPYRRMVQYKSIIESEIHNYKGVQRVRRKLDPYRRMVPSLRHSPLCPDLGRQEWT